MKNIKQIQQNIKASGLTGNDYENEFYDQALMFAKQLAIELTCLVQSHEPDWEDALLGLAQISEVYFEIARTTDRSFSFAEDLQHEIFNISPEHSKSYLKWRERLFGNDVEAKKKPAVIDAESENGQPKAKTLAEHHLRITANKIAHILQSDDVPDDTKIAFQSILSEMANEANVGVDSPELVKQSLPLLVESLNPTYAKGFLHALRSLLDNCLDGEIEDELRQYEKRFDGRTEDELKVLDLSNSSIEDLSKTLSGIMQNPNLPKSIKDCLEDNLHSPENILENLEKMR